MGQSLVEPFAAFGCLTKDAFGVAVAKQDEGTREAPVAATVRVGDPIIVVGDTAVRLNDMYSDRTVHALYYGKKGRWVDANTEKRKEDPTKQFKRKWAKQAVIELRSIIKWLSQCFYTMGKDILTNPLQGL